MIQQNITIFLGVDYTILGNQRMLNQQQYSCSATAEWGHHDIGWNLYGCINTIQRRDTFWR